MTNTSSNPSRVPNLYICRIRQNIPASGLWIYLPTQSRELNFCNGCSKIAQKLINQLWSGFSTSYGIFFTSWPSTNRIHKNLSNLEHFSLKSNLSKTKLEFFLISQLWEYVWFLMCTCIGYLKKVTSAPKLGWNFLLNDLLLKDN